MFDFHRLKLPGLIQILPRRFEDHRGRFVKTFHIHEFHAAQLGVNWAEEFYTHSHAGVLRGLHFQRPPHEHSKLVYCVEGDAFDVVVDLRRGSPTYGEHVSIRLSASEANMLFIPPGMAHGFYAATDTTMMYKVSSVYHPDLDDGILWSSVGIDWPTRSPVLSDRDEKLIEFAAFSSPFEYRTTDGVL